MRAVGIPTACSLLSFFMFWACRQPKRQHSSLGPSFEADRQRVAKAIRARTGRYFGIQALDAYVGGGAGF